MAKKAKKTSSHSASFIDNDELWQKPIMDINKGVIIGFVSIEKEHVPKGTDFALWPGTDDDRTEILAFGINVKKGGDLDIKPPVTEE